MFVRSILACLLTCCAATPVAAEDLVNLLGHNTRRQDYVLGVIEAVSGNNIVISLGFDHGMLENSNVMVLRETASSYDVIEFLRVGLVKRESSFARGSGEVKLLRGDVVLIRADQLALWQTGLTEEELRILRNDIARSDKNGYDKRFNRIDGRALQREHQANREKMGDYWMKFVRNQQQAEGLERTGPGPLPEPAAKLSANQVRQLPTEAEWLAESFELVQTRGLNVIPSERKTGLRLAEGETIMTPLLDKIREAWKKQGL